LAKGIGETHERDKDESGTDPATLFQSLLPPLTFKDEDEDDYDERTRGEGRGAETALSSADWTNAAPSDRRTRRPVNQSK